MELRDAYFSTLHARCARDPSIIILSGDFSAHWLDRIAHDFPHQYINAGIAEQNMVSVAAGLALEGRKPFVVGQNNFITLRAMDQVSVDLCQMALPVTLVGIGAGYTFSIDSPTHHGVTDLGMMLQLPCDIYNVSDSSIATECAALEAVRPTYIRLGKGEVPDLNAAWLLNHNFDGYSIIYDADPMVVASGAMVAVAHDAVNGMAGLIDLYRPAPFPKYLTNDLRGRRVLVLEDNLCAPLSTMLRSHGIECESIAPTKYLFEFGTTEYLHSKAGIDAASLRAKING